MTGLSRAQQLRRRQIVSGVLCRKDIAEMRYRLILLPFLERYHITLTSWDEHDPERTKRVQFWDVGPEHISNTDPWALLSYVAGDLAADQD